MNWTSGGNITNDDLDKVSVEVPATCHWWFKLVNPDGALYQTSSVQALRYTMHVETGQLPLTLLIRPTEDPAFLMKSLFDLINIRQHGDYHFILEKTSFIRLPAPYSKPSCVVQGSPEALEKNLFVGNYSLSKCQYSCKLKSKNF